MLVPSYVVYLSGCSTDDKWDYNLNFECSLQICIGSQVGAGHPSIIFVLLIWIQVTGNSRAISLRPPPPALLVGVPKLVKLQLLLGPSSRWACLKHLI